jgi:hypothetical protein
MFSHPNVDQWRRLSVARMPNLAMIICQQPSSFALSPSVIHLFSGPLFLSSSESLERSNHRSGNDNSLCPFVEHISLLRPDQRNYVANDRLQSWLFNPQCVNGVTIVRQAICWLFGWWISKSHLWDSFQGNVVPDAKELSRTCRANEWRGQTMRALTSDLRFVSWEKRWRAFTLTGYCRRAAPGTTREGAALNQWLSLIHSFYRGPKHY